jgi:hypothetical protein
MMVFRHPFSKKDVIGALGLMMALVCGWVADGRAAVITDAAGRSISFEQPFHG